MGSQGAGEELPYTGSRISLITTSDIRYEGILDSINTVASTVSLRFVQSFGTEDRPVPIPVPPSPEIYNSVVFYGKHIKDLTVCSEPEVPAAPAPPYPQDPAIISMDMGGPSGAPQRPGAPSSLLRPGVGSPASHVTGGPSGDPSSMFGALGGAPNAPNEMADSCCAPGASFPGRGGPTPQQQTVEDLGSVGATGGPPQQHDGVRPPSNSRGRGGAKSGGGPGGGRQGGGRGRGPRPDGRDGERGGRTEGRGGGYKEALHEPVGELASRPNMQLKNEVAEEFDFDAMNSKFEKPATMGEGKEFAEPVVAYDKNLSFFDSISCEALDKRGGGAGGGGGQDQQQQQQNEGKGPEDGRGRRLGGRQNRALDIDTFGEGAANFTVRYMGGRRGGRGKGRGNFNRGGGPGGPGRRPRG